MKNAQAAVEFVMTYGIALIVVFGSIVAMQSMGILDFTILFKESCARNHDVVCEDLKVTREGNFTIVIRNSLGTDMGDVLLSINSTKCSQNAIVSTIAKNQRASIDLQCGYSFFENEKFKGDIEVRYTNNKIGQEYVKFGTFSIKVED